MLKIKLARFGKKNQPHYRIVVNEARDKRDGSYVANIGHYAPTQNPKLLQLDLEAYQEWIKKGAQPTDTVAMLAKKAQEDTPWVATKRISKKQAAKNAAPQEEVAPVEPAAAEEKTEEVVSAETESTEAAVENK